MKKCVHYWSYPHSIWEGRKNNEVAVGRYCSKCGKQQMAFVSAWGPVRSNYVDIRDELRGLRPK